MLESLRGRAIGVMGWKDSGKTLVVERLVTSLVRRGFGVGTVKHVHEALSLQPAAKDSVKHLDAGAEIAIALGDGLMVMGKHERFQKAQRCFYKCVFRQRAGC